jgi:hypothetical protein
MASLELVLLNIDTEKIVHVFLLVLRCSVFILFKSNYVAQSDVDAHDHNVL